MQVQGACHCGAIAFEAAVDPAEVEICHCADCQTLSGSAFRTVVPAPAAGFRLLRGTPKLYPRRADSGAMRLQAFCPACGTPLWSTSDGGTPGGYTLRVGCLAERDRLAPRRQYWLRSARPWAQDLSGLEGHESQ